MHRAKRIKIILQLVILFGSFQYLKHENFTILKFFKYKYQQPKLLCVLSKYLDPIKL